MELLQAILHLDKTLDLITAQYGSLVYLAIFTTVFCETGMLALFFLPGVPLLFISGALCATGVMNIWMLIGLLFTAAVAGSHINYWFGRAVGKKVLPHNYKWINRDALQKTHTFFEKYGDTTFLVYLFIPFVRTFAPFVAGVSTMTYKKFQLFSMAGAGLWVVVLLPAGYFFGNIPFVHGHLNIIVLMSVFIGLGLTSIGGLWKLSKKLLAR